ncbi:MAG: hypothetical protein AMXMBFR64_15410 [Myxococcales bacterium]
MSSPDSRWERSEKYLYLFFKLVFFGTVVAGALLLLRELSTVTTPILLALVLAYVTSPFVDTLERRRVPRLLTAIVMVLLVLAGAFLFMVFLIPRVVEQVLALIARLPNWVSDTLGTVRPWIERTFELQLDLDPDQIRVELSQFTQRVVGDWSNLVETALTSAFALAVALGNLLLIPLFTVYLLKDFPHIRDAAIDLVPPRHRARLSAVATRVNAVVASYVRGTLIVIAILAVVYSVALSIMGIPFAILLGIAGAFLNVIPWVGPVVGMVLTLLMALLEGMGWGTMLGVVLLFAIVPVIDTSILSPNIVGERVGLPPLTVIIAILVFGQLFGVVGILLAVPVSAVLKVLMSEVLRAWHESEVYRRT